MFSLIWSWFILISKKRVILDARYIHKTIEIWISKIAVFLESFTKIKTNLIFFHFLFWYLKRFYKGFKGPHKTFWGTIKKYENKKLSLFVPDRDGKGFVSMSSFMRTCSLFVCIEYGQKN